MQVGFHALEFLVEGAEGGAGVLGQGIVVGELAESLQGSPGVLMFVLQLLEDVTATTQIVPVWPPE